MDVSESTRRSKKHTAIDSPRLSILAERNNAVATRRPQTREISSRYRSPTPSTPTGQRRYPSPILSRTASAAVPKRAQSAERKRPSTPPSSTRPSTPVQDTSVDMRLSSRRTASGRLTESLWPSTMRSLNVSFQSDSISIPVSKKEKPLTSTDRTLKPTSKVAHRQAETPTIVRKPTPEGKRSPQKGKNNCDHSENSKPIDRLPTRLIDQHRWPSRVSGKLSSTGLTKSLDLGDRVGKTSTLGTGMGSSSLRRMSLPNGIGKPFQKSSSGAVQLKSLEGFETKSIDDNSLWKADIHKLLSAISADRMTSTNHAVRSHLLSNGSRPSSPIKTSHPPSPRVSRPSSPSRTPLSSSISRGISPSRTRPSTPPSRGVSPSRNRMSSPTSQSSSSTSVLSFIADIPKGKKVASYIEDAHQLRLLHNRYLQWRFANSQAEALLYIQKVTAERTLYNVWATTLALRDSVVRKRISVQQLKLELKLNSILNEQMPFLNDWALLERDYLHSVSRAVEDLEASTLRLPVTRGAGANIDTLKAAVCSALDVMQAMGSSICSLLSRVEAMNCMLSELVVRIMQETIMLDECENLLVSIAAMQIEENSLRTNLIQMQQALERGEQELISTVKSSL